RKNYVYSRLELADKNQLLRDEDLLQLGIDDHHPSFRIGPYSFGAVRDIWTSKKLILGLGGDVTFYSKPPILNPVYGDNPMGYHLFLRLQTGKMDMSGHGP